jgi:hypothetical protein
LPRACTPCRHERCRDMEVLLAVYEVPSTRIEDAGSQKTTAILNLRWRIKKEVAMPYKDPEKRQTYQREYKRMQRAGSSQTPGQTLIPMSFRLKTAQDVLALIEEQVNAVREEPEAGTLEKARAAGYLASIALKAVEVADLSARLEAVEQVLKRRKAA